MSRLTRGLSPAIALLAAVGCQSVGSEISAEAGLTSQPNADVCSATPHHELPVLTHFSAAKNGFDPLGVDVPDLYAPFDGKPYAPSSCQPYWKGRVPDFQEYIGDTYATSPVSDADAAAFLRAQCEESNVAFQLFRADATVRDRLRSSSPQGGSGAVQIVHGMVIDDALATVVLPANWSKTPPPGGYPIVASGFYDQNDNVFRTVGPMMMPMIARSASEGRTGAIGVIWNGGGSHVTRSTNPRVSEQFASIVGWVQQQFGGDPDRIVAFGGSRGGTTALTIASNPKSLPYRVRFAAVAAPPVRIGEHATLQSTTYPGLIGAAANSVGFHDLWHKGWRYPACAGKPHLTGKTAAEAHVYVLTGTTDSAYADAHLTPYSDDFVAGLVRAGTQVYLEAGSHDAVVPFGEEIEYGLKIAIAGVPLEAEVMLRAGHHSRQMAERTWEALKTYVDPLRAGTHPTVTPGVSYFRVNRQQGVLEPFALEDGLFPFTMDAPRWIAPGTRVPFVFSGAAYTDWDLVMTGPGGLRYEWTGRLPSSLKSIQWVDVASDQAPGDYTYRLSIRKPGAVTWKEVTGTLDGSSALVTVVGKEADFSADQLVQSLTAPNVKAFPATHWGLSEY